MFVKLFIATQVVWIDSNFMESCLQLQKTVGEIKFWSQNYDNIFICLL